VAVQWKLFQSAGQAEGQKPENWVQCGILEFPVLKVSAYAPSEAKNGAKWVRLKTGVMPPCFYTTAN